MKDKSTNYNRTTTNTRPNPNRNRNKKRSRQLSTRGIITILVMLLIPIVIVVSIVSSNVGGKDIQKISSNLTENLGKSISDVENSTRVDFNQSASNELLANLTKFNYISESPKVTRVCGVRIPTWVIYAKINKLESITQFTIYNFTALEDNVLGTEVEDYIDTSELSNISESSLMNTMGMQPYITNIFEDGTKKLFFRYYYRNSTSKNDVSVQVCVDLDRRGMVTKVSETDIDFISNILSLEEVSETD